MSKTSSSASAAAAIAALLCVVAACDSHSPESPSPATAPIPAAAPQSSDKSKPKTSDSIVFTGHGWLSARQDADGQWRDAATTGIVLLTYFGAGETHQSGSKREVVRRALDTLRTGQDADGCVAEPTSPRRLREHAIAGLALTESYGMTGSLALKRSAQRAVDFALKARAPGGAWNFTTTHVDQIDVETTVWMALLVKSAQLSELDVDRAVLGEVAAALDRITEPTTGRIIGPPNSPSTISTDAETAAALVVKVFAGRRIESDPAMAKTVDFLVARPPSEESTDLPFVHFSRIAMLALGGERFRSWLPGLNAFVKAPCVVDGPNRGSWDPPGGGGERERIWATAYHLFACECY